MSTIYRKTDQGHDEIATRARRLVPRLRQALIVVDGKRTDEDLRKLIAPPADEVLQALLEQGYIEMISVTTVHVALPATPTPATAPVVLTLDETRRRAVRWISDALGPYGDPLNLRIERVRKPEDMRQALTLASAFIRQQLGAAKATEFERHVGL
jgi:hypothetical protein